MNSRAIEHVVVLMLENNSFDHLLGYLPNGGGLTGHEFNLVNPSDPTSERVYVNNQAGYIPDIDPAHDLLSAYKQMFGNQGHVSDPAPMNGFVMAAIETAQGNLQVGKKVMDCFDPDALPALKTLAQEFCLCTRWFSSVPGPTWLNRFFVHAATSDGIATNDVEHPYDMRTIYENLAANGLSWSIYYGDIPQSLALRRLWSSLEHVKEFEEFHTDVESGKLANYVFIEPRYMNFFVWKANDEHPPHDVKLGEYLIAEIYDTLRNSPLWEKSLLVILYDEHGGFFDSVSPPASVPNPDSKTSADPPFDFTRLGVRVPAVLVSPFIERGVVDTTIYEHASIPATLKTLFNLPEYLTARDKAANTFEKNLSQSAPRSDTPSALPVPGLPGESSYHRELMRVGSLAERVLSEIEQKELSQAPLSEFQGTLVELANQLNDELQAGAAIRSSLVQTEHEAAVHVQEILRNVLKR